jgi:prepilin-type N-terminal cleavage/methylation domain-containing protein
MKTEQKNKQGFSLVELLTVMAILLLLTGLSVPSILGARSTYYRKAAVDMVMATIEQARVDALESGANTYVIIALSKDSALTPDEMIVVGDQPLGASATGQVFYTHWIKLPLNIRFWSTGPNTLASNNVPLTTSQLSALPPTFDKISPSFRGFTFDPTGTLINPQSGVGLDLALYEGLRNGGGETAVGASAAASKAGGSTMSASGIYDVIRMDRYSGRTWAEVSNLINP